MEEKTRNVSHEEDTQMIELWKTGMSYEAVSKKLGRSARVVQEHIRKAKADGRIPKDFKVKVKRRRRKRSSSFNEMRQQYKNPPEKPDGIVVKCTASVAKKCVYGCLYQPNQQKCDYILCEGHMRGCPPEQCWHFAKVTRENKRRRPTI